MSNSDRNRMLDRTFSIPKSNELAHVITHLSPFEKVVFSVLVIVFALSSLALLFNFNEYLLVEVPAEGGSLTEGVIGSPRFINPLLAISDADRDLTSLVYSGLLKATPQGELTEDLALEYSISPDGLTYTFVLRDDISFHDGTPVSADDVLFTISRAQDPALKSPKRAVWDGVRVQKTGEKEIQFFLNQPYSPFLENVTLGILPEHIWKNIDTEQFPFSQFNIDPIGSGPYKIKRIKRDSSGIPDFYELTPFQSHALGKPFISNLQIKFFVSEEQLLNAFKGKDVDAINSIAPEKLLELSDVANLRIEKSPLPRIFAIFFNQNQATVFTNKEVRAALNVGLDKEKIVNEVLGGYGTEIDSPVPPGIINRTVISATPSEEEEAETKVEKARDILSRNGWEFNEEEGVWEKKTKKEDFRLEFALSTSNAPELIHVAEIIKEEWGKIGVPVDVKIFETGDLNQNIIRPRRYDSLLFGEIVGRELDLFAFWHSSQRNDPGLNVALYANITADKVLENARSIFDKIERVQKYKEFEDEILNDIPAVFLYAPDFIYIIPEKVSGLRLGSVTTPGERFLNVHEWYTEVDKVWSFFTDK